MFVRFRKLPCDGFRPRAASAPYIACRQPWNGPNGLVACRGHCHLKPRCRWRIGREEELAPYRLKVVLVENKRVNGKVKQETIAVLGSIEATLLLDFWEGIDREAAAKLKTEDWELLSLQWRTAFWQGANRRLKRLTNRLGPETKRIRMAVHARVPWPVEQEREKLELLEAKEDYDRAKGNLESGQRTVATSKRLVKKALETLAENEELARWEAREATDAAAKLAKLSNRRP